MFQQAADGYTLTQGRVSCTCSFMLQETLGLKTSYESNGYMQTPVFKENLQLNEII